MSSSKSTISTTSSLLLTQTTTGTSTNCSAAIEIDSSHVPKNDVEGKSLVKTPLISLPENSRIIQLEYLNKHFNKNDLSRRLGNVVQVLRHDESIEPDSAEWPGLGGVAQYIAQNFVQHPDKEIRLYAVLACMEIFTIYAPEVPWDRDELIQIFQQTVRQLANLSHTTDPLKQPNFRHYSHILELFAQIKIGCVIVDLAQQEGNDTSLLSMIADEDGGDDDNLPTKDTTPDRRSRSARHSSVSRKSSTATSPLEVVVDLIHTLLHCVRNEHPIEIIEMIQQAIVACLDEYNPDQGAPIPVSLLDEILLCIGQGPTVLVTNVVAHQQLSKSSSVTNKKSSPRQTRLPMQIEQTNPTFVAAAAVIRCMINKLATPIAQLLNGLLNGDSFILEQSSIRCPTSSASLHGLNSSLSPVSERLPQTDFDTNVDVYSIVYELHRVAPQILTTVIGTVSNGLRSQDCAKRASVTDLLGRLFSSSSSSPSFASTSGHNSWPVVSSCSMASEFRVCYREWLGRSNDADWKIRRSVVQHCVAMIRQEKNVDTSSTAIETSNTLCKLLTSDPNLDVRLAAIHQVTEWVYRQTTGRSTIPSSILRGMGSRCSSKQKQERRDAITGLAKIYSRQYLSLQLKSVVAGGEDCPIALVQEILDRTCDNVVASAEFEPFNKEKRRKAATSIHNRKKDDTGDKKVLVECEEDKERYAWIPMRIFECLCITEQADPELRRRATQIIDDVLLGTVTSHVEGDSAMISQNSVRMTATARVLGFVMIQDSLSNKSCANYLHTMLQSNTVCNNDATNAFKFMYQFLVQRSRLQKALSSYIDVRAAIRRCVTGTEEQLAHEAKALELLSVVANLCPPSSTQSTASTQELLTSFHGARDKHVFRILSTITDPNHTLQARIHALDELPKRTKSLGNEVSDWIRSLVKQCAMSDFLNGEVVTTCVLLAKDTFNENDIGSTASLLFCVKIATEIFPSVAATDVAFLALSDLFKACRQSKAETKEKLQDFGVITCLSTILSIAATTNPTVVEKMKVRGSVQDLKNHLLRLCTYDGNPEQARNAVYALSRLLIRQKTRDDDISDILSAKSSQSQHLEQHDNMVIETFSPLLSKLTSTASLKVIVESNRNSSRIVSTLAALSALSECEPVVMTFSIKGMQTFKYVLEIVLKGRDPSLYCLDNDDDLMADEDISATTPVSTRKGHRVSLPASKTDTVSHVSPKGNGNILQDDTLSIHCRQVCSAIDFLVVYIRSAYLLRMKRRSLRLSGDKDEVPCPSDDDVKSLFRQLTQILHDEGLPPSTRDRQFCKNRQDRAALRQCATIYLLRLSDSRIGLENKFMTSSMWHALSESFLDEELSVREAAMKELSQLLIGAGVYGMEFSKQLPRVPSLRFLALASLCSDGDHGTGNDLANGNAANVGKTSLIVKSAILQCIDNLRLSADASYAQCRALGKEAEKRFESQVKMLLMPEYSVPFCFHLLAHRRETPSGASPDELRFTKTAIADSKRRVDKDDGNYRVLRKRLKLLLEPLVSSLGDGADNISFLLRMAEVLGKGYAPVDASFSCEFTTYDKDGEKSKRLASKLLSVCVTGRDILLALVKKDVNLSDFPGSIQLPRHLFVRKDCGSVKIPSIPCTSTDDQSLTSTVLSDLYSEGEEEKVAPKFNNMITTKIIEEFRADSSVSANQKHLDLQDSSTKNKRKEENIESTERTSVGAHVHFSPDVVGGIPAGIIDANCKENTFDYLSPIAKSLSPGFSKMSRSGDNANQCRTVVQDEQSQHLSTNANSTEAEIISNFFENSSISKSGDEKPVTRYSNLLTDNTSNDIQHSTSQSSISFDEVFASSVPTRLSSSRSKSTSNDEAVSGRIVKILQNRKRKVDESRKSDKVKRDENKIRRSKTGVTKTESRGSKLNRVVLSGKRINTTDKSIYEKLSNELDFDVGSGEENQKPNRKNKKSTKNAPLRSRRYMK